MRQNDCSTVASDAQLALVELCNNPYMYLIMGEFFIFELVPEFFKRSLLCLNIIFFLRKFRNILVKFRTNKHRPPIAVGRWKNLRPERITKLGTNFTFTFFLARKYYVQLNIKFCNLLMNTNSF